MVADQHLRRHHLQYLNRCICLYCDKHIDEPCELILDPSHPVIFEYGALSFFRAHWIPSNTPLPPSTQHVILCIGIDNTAMLQAGRQWIEEGKQVQLILLDSILTL